MAQTNLFTTRRMSSQIYQDNLKKFTRRTAETQEVASPPPFVNSEERGALTRRGVQERTKLDAKFALFQTNKDLRRMFGGKGSSGGELPTRRQTVDQDARLILREYVRSETCKGNDPTGPVGQRKLLKKLIPGTASIEDPKNPSLTKKNTTTAQESISDSEVKESTMNVLHLDQNALRSQPSISKRVITESKEFRDAVRNQKSNFAPGHVAHANGDYSGQIVSILRIQPSESKNNWSIRDTQRALTVGKKNVVFAAEKMPRSKVGFKDGNTKKRPLLWCCS